MAEELTNAINEEDIEELGTNRRNRSNRGGPGNEALATNDKVRNNVYERNHLTVKLEE